jgi:DNA-binding MarR family transcriptional regulator
MNNEQGISIREQCVVVSQTCAGGSLRRASRAVTQFYAEIMAPSGLQPTQFTLLAAFAVAGGAPISVLADVLVMDRTTLTRNVKLLEKQGLVVVRLGTDHRVRIVALSETGRNALAAAIPFWQKAQSQVAKGLGQEGLVNLLQDMSKVVDLVRGF